MMVVITVVLVAVLYVTVMTCGDVFPREPIGKFTGSSKLDATSERLTFSAFNLSPSIDSCKIGVDPPWDAPNAGAPNLGDMMDTSTLYACNSTFFLTIIVLGDDGRISQGDSVTIIWTSTKPSSGERTASVCTSPRIIKYRPLPSRSEDRTSCGNTSPYSRSTALAPFDRRDQPSTKPSKTV